MKSLPSGWLANALSAVVILAPVFFGAVHPWASMGLASAAFFLLFLYPESLGGIKTLPVPVSVGLMFVAVFIGVQFFCSSLVPSAHLEQTILWLAFAVFFLLVQILPPEGIGRLLTAFMVLGLIETLYAGQQLWSDTEKVLWIVKKEHVGFATGTYFNRNHFAGAIELSLGIFLGFLLKALARRKWIEMSAFAAGFTVLLAALFLSGSRSGMASFAFAALIMSLFMRKQGLKMKLLFIFLIALAFAGALAVAKETFAVRFLEPQPGIMTWEGRLLVWADALGMLKNFGLLGTGLGSFEWVFPGYQSETLILGWTHAHNDYLELVAELGVPAAALFFSCMAALIVRGLRSLTTAPRSRQLYFLYGAMTGILSLSLHAFVDFNFAIPANAYLWIILLAAATRLAGLNDGQKSSK